MTRLCCVGTMFRSAMCMSAGLQSSFLREQLKEKRVQAALAGGGDVVSRAFLMALVRLIGMPSVGRLLWNVMSWLKADCHQRLLILCYCCNEMSCFLKIYGAEMESNF